MCHKLRMASIATRLRQLRQLRAVTQDDLAAAVNCDRSMISKIEKGKEPGRALLVRLAEFYNVSLDWLMHGNGAAEGALTPPLNPREIQVLEAFRQLPDADAELMLRMLQAAAKPKK